MTKSPLENAVDALNETPATPAAQIMEMTEKGHTKDAPKNKHIHVLVKTQTVEKLDEIAKANGITRSFLINDVLQDYVIGAFNKSKTHSTWYLE